MPEIDPYPIGAEPKQIEDDLLSALLDYFSDSAPLSSYHLDRFEPFDQYMRRTVRGHLAALCMVGEIEQYGRTRGGLYRTTAAGKRHLKTLVKAGKNGNR